MASAYLQRHYKTGVGISKRRATFEQIFYLETLSGECNSSDCSESLCVKGRGLNNSSGRDHFRNSRLLINHISRASSRTLSLSARHFRYIIFERKRERESGISTNVGETERRRERRDEREKREGASSFRRKNNLISEKTKRGRRTIFLRVFKHTDTTERI